MTGNEPPLLIAWDSCIFLAHFNEEQDKPLAEIDGILRQVARGHRTMLISAIVRAEVLNETGTSDAGTQFCDYCKRSNVITASADFRIADAAAVIREKVRDARTRGDVSNGIKAPDALIAATAILYRATALHTFDPVLLELSGSPILRGLKIMRPDAGEAHNQPLLP